jgi:hypothetical protein
MNVSALIFNLKKLPLKKYCVCNLSKIAHTCDACVTYVFTWVQQKKILTYF